MLRSNWRVYPAEMAQALALTGVDRTGLEPLAPSGEPLTDFEDKYRHSGHVLWELVADLDQS